MKEILEFSRNRCTSVNQVDEHTMKAVCRLQDTLMDAFVAITVRLPDLEITAVEAEIFRNLKKKDRDNLDPIKKIVGVRIGPGLLKIIKGLINGTGDCRQLTFMVEECCQTVILAFTKEQMLDVPSDIEEAKLYYHDMVEKNMNLYNRCAAFAKGSSLVEGLEPS